MVWRLLVGLVVGVLVVAAEAAERVEVVVEAALDGRVLVILAADEAREPRFQVNGTVRSAQVFGVDVERWDGTVPAVVDETRFGYPARSLGAVPPGEYWVQGVLQKYETFRPAHGHTLKLPMDQGEGRQWTRAPGEAAAPPGADLTSWRY